MQRFNHFSPSRSSGFRGYEPPSLDRPTAEAVLNIAFKAPLRVSESQRVALFGELRRSIRSDRFDVAASALRRALQC